MQILEITQDNFEKEVLQAEGTVLVDFWAPWCGPCMQVAPNLDALAETVDYAKIGKINVDEQPALASKYKVMTIPTFIVFKNGEVANRVSDVLSKEQLEELIK